MCCGDYHFAQYLAEVKSQSTPPLLSGTSWVEKKGGTLPKKKGCSQMLIYVPDDQRDMSAGFGGRTFLP